MRVLVTRPLEDARQTASLLEAAGHEVLLAPLLKVNLLDADIPSHASGLVATSANGVRGFCRLSTRRDVPLFAVGSHTAHVAREAGFVHVREADGDAAALASAIAGWIKPGPLLHLAGQHGSGVLGQSLAAQGFTLDAVTLYDVVAEEHFPPEALAALKENRVEAALFFSPRSARIFVRCAAADGLSMMGVIAACLSPAVAEGLAGTDFSALRIAPKPSQKALIGLL